MTGSPFPKEPNMPAKLKSLNINLPFGLGGATIEINENQQHAAWALYVEMATRVAGEELKPGMGSAREALNSLYSLFETTRAVLREADKQELFSSPHRLLIVSLVLKGLAACRERAEHGET